MKTTSILLLLIVGVFMIQAQSTNANKLHPPITTMSVTIKDAPAGMVAATPAPAGIVTTDAETRTISSLDGKLQLKVGRRNLLSASIQGSLIGNTYTYTITNDQKSKQTIDFILIEGNFTEDHLVVTHPNWVGSKNSLATGFLDASKGTWKKGLKQGESLTFYGVAAPGFTPGQVKVHLVSEEVPASAAGFTSAYMPKVHIQGNYPGDATHEFVRFVDMNISDPGVTLTTVGPQ